MGVGFCKNHTPPPSVPLPDLRQTEIKPLCSEKKIFLILVEWNAEPLSGTLPFSILDTFLEWKDYVRDHNDEIPPILGAFYFDPLVRIFRFIRVRVNNSDSNEKAGYLLPEISILLMFFIKKSTGPWIDVLRIFCYCTGWSYSALCSMISIFKSIWRMMHKASIQICNRITEKNLCREVLVHFWI